MLWVSDGPRERRADRGASGVGGSTCFHRAADEKAEWRIGATEDPMYMSVDGLEHAVAGGVKGRELGIGCPVASRARDGVGRSGKIVQVHRRGS